MSMKRSKKSSSSSSSKPGQAEGSLGFNPPPSALPKWEEVTADKPDEAFTPYTVGRTYTRGDLVMHPKFGKGCVVAVNGVRIEVVFSDGARKLAQGAS